MFQASNIRYELAERTRGLAAGGIGSIHLLAQRVGLDQEIDRRLHLLKYHRPYHESDHVLNIAYNLLAGGTCLEHLELRRNDEVYLDALGARRIPDPTTAGDFCRRFTLDDLDMSAAGHQRRRGSRSGGNSPTLLRRSDLRRRRHHGRDHRRVQIRTWTSTTKASGAIIRWSSRWPTRANRCILRQPPRQPSQPRRGGLLFRPVDRVVSAGRLPQDHACAATPTSRRPPIWTAGTQRACEFIFGIDAMPKLYELAENLPEEAWKPLS